MDLETTLGRMLVVDRDLLKKSIYVLSLLAAQSTRLVVENIYKGKLAGTVGKALINFTKLSAKPFGITVNTSVEQTATRKPVGVAYDEC